MIEGNRQGDGALHFPGEQQQVIRIGDLIHQHGKRPFRYSRHSVGRAQGAFHAGGFDPVHEMTVQFCRAFGDGREIIQLDDEDATWRPCFCPRIKADSGVKENRRFRVGRSPDRTWSCSPLSVRPERRTTFGVQKVARKSSA